MGRGAGCRDRLLLVVLAVVVLAAGLAVPSAGAAKGPKKPRAPRAAGFGPAAATGAFGLDLMRAHGPGNVVLSPDSISAALAMTGTGAAGQTEQEMVRTLRLEGPASFAEVGDLQRAIVAGHAAASAGDPTPPVLEIANGLFPQTGLPFNPAFMSVTQGRFGASPMPLDYENDLNGALAAINGWVSERTHGKIPQILDYLPPLTALALANAIYLEADWVHPFQEGRTAPAPFYGSTGRASVEMMRQTAPLRYGAGPGYRAVSMPYRSSNLSMMVVLPSGRRIGALERDLGGKGIARVARRMKTTPVDISLPRFHLNILTELTPALQKLGMPTAFSNGADFSRITTAAELKIGLVRHAADYIVDEGGTVATAATVVVMVKKSKPKEPADPVVFKANRPFLFFLRDDRTGAVLFAGRLTQPSS